MLDESKSRSALREQLKGNPDAPSRKRSKASATRTTFRFTPWGLWTLNELSRYEEKTKGDVIETSVRLIHGVIWDKDREVTNTLNFFFERTYDAANSVRRTQLVTQETIHRLREISKYYETSRDHALEVILLVISGIVRSDYEADLARLEKAEALLDRLENDVIRKLAEKIEREYEEEIRSFPDRGTLTISLDTYLTLRHDELDIIRTDLSDPFESTESPESPFDKSIDVGNA